MERGRVLIAGGGGHAKVAIEVLRAAGWLPWGILDPQPAGKSVLDVPILGGEGNLEELLSAGLTDAFIAIGRNDLRRTLARRYQRTGFNLVSAVHPSVCLSPSASVGNGVLLMPNACINASAQIGDLAIVNTGAIVEHDCIVGEGAHLAPRSVLGGGASVGEEAFIGIGAVILPRIKVGARAVVGGGAVVVNDVDEDDIVTGVPAKPRSKIKRGGEE